MNKAIKIFLPLAAFALTAGMSYGATLITPTGVTVSSQLSGSYAAANTINGSGLNAPGDETATHVNGTGSGTMWLASTAAGTGVGQFITFNLGSEMDLDGAYIWNFNQDGQGGRGYLNFDIYVGDSSDLAATTLLVSGASIVRDGGSGTVSAQFEPLLASGVQYVKLLSQSNGTNNIVGLSEVRFVEAAAIPEPTTTALLGLGGLALILRRRR
jgi:hypothetical protein